MNPTLERLGRVALDLLYPPRCLLCGRGGEFVCGRCRAELPRAQGSRRERCWLPLPNSQGCGRCAERPLALTELRSVFRYEDSVRRLVRGLKFGGYSCLAEPLGDELAGAGEGWAAAVDAIVPVPLTGSHLRQRGFNQAALLARRAGRIAGLPVEELLQRRGASVAQARSAGAEERWRNVQGVFGPKPRAPIEGRRLLLIDDVATTGATLDACARALLAAGAVEVRGLTVARED